MGFKIPKGAARQYIVPALIFLGGLVAALLFLAGGMGKIADSLIVLELPAAKEIYFPKGGGYTLFLSHPEISKEEKLPQKLQPQGKVTAGAATLPLTAAKTLNYFSFQGLKAKAVWDLVVPEEGSYFFQFEVSDQGGNLLIGRAVQRRLVVLILLAGALLCISILLAVVLILKNINRTIHDFLDNIA